MTKDKQMIKDLEAKIKIRDHYRNVSIQQNYAAGVEYDSGYICGLEFAIHLIKESNIDENAETLEDKLRDEHRPIPEEREDSNLFKSMTDKFTEKMEDINGPEAYDSYYEEGDWK